MPTSWLPNGSLPSALAVWCLWLAAAGAANAQTTVVGFDDAGASWKYLDNGSDPGEQWTSKDFDDSAWKSGAAPLGYGDEGLRTTLDSGKDPAQKPIAAYFRRTIVVKSPDKLRHLVLYVRADDGLVAYVNGKEAVRMNMPAGMISPDTTATERLSGLDEHLYHRFVLPADAFVEGQNLLAVEVHQVDAASSDLHLNIALKSHSKDEPPRPMVTPAADAVIKKFRQEHYVGAGLTIPDGYTDGGRGMVIESDSSVRSGRELIVVDRTRDAALKSHLEFARAAELKAKLPLERATEIAKDIDKDMTGALSRDVADDTTELLVSQNRNEGVLLGEVPKLCGAGACRHRSLLFKLMADEAGLDAALVRGNAIFGFAAGGHAWNELRLADGKVLLVDVMNPLPEFRFPDLDEPIARMYYTVDNKPFYPVKE